MHEYEHTRFIHKEASPSGKREAGLVFGKKLSAGCVKCAQASIICLSVRPRVCNRLINARELYTTDFDHPRVYRRGQACSI